MKKRQIDAENLRDAQIKRNKREIDEIMPQECTDASAF